MFATEQRWKSWRTSVQRTSLHHRDLLKPSWTYLGTRWMRICSWISYATAYTGRRVFDWRNRENKENTFGYRNLEKGREEGRGKRMMHAMGKKAQYLTQTETRRWEIHWCWQKNLWPYKVSSIAAGPRGESVAQYWRGSHTFPCIVFFGVLRIQNGHCMSPLCTAGNCFRRTPAAEDGTSCLEEDRVWLV